MAAALGSLVVSLEANIASFTADMGKAAYQTEQTMKKMQADAKLMGIALGAMAATAAVSLVVMTQRSMEAADALGKMAEKTGIAVTQLAGLELAAGMAGVNADALGGGLTKLNKSIAEAAAGNQITAAAFDAMGISITDATGQTKTADVVFKEISGKFEGYANGAEKVALAQAVLGKSGADMIVLLNGGSAAIQELSDYSAKYSGVTEELVKQSTVFNDTLSLMEVHQKSLGNILAAETLPILQAIADEMLKGSENSNKFAVAGSAVRVVFETLTVVASEVAFVFAQVGNTIGGTAAQLERLAHLDFKGVANINDMIKADDVQARKDHDAFLDRVMRTGSSAVTPEGTPVPKPSAPKLPGVDSKGKDTAAQEAKAQLVSDLDQLKKASEAITDQYGNAEKVMQAMRSANLVSDEDYFASKLGFLNLYSAAQATELQAEIDRMQQENLIGKAKIDNDRKIFDAQSKLAKAQAEGVTGVQILSIQKADYLEKIKRGYIEAEAAAQAFADTANRQYKRELDGLGMGQQNRQRNAGVSQIEDKYSQQLLQLASEKRQGKFLGRDDDYKQELDRINRFQAESLSSFNAYYDALIAKQGDWSLGASEAIRNYMDNANNTAAQIENSVTGAFKSMEDAIVQFAMTGKLSFADMARSIIGDLIRIQAQKALAGLGSTLIGMISGGGGVADSFGGSVMSAANGYDIPAGVNPMTQLHEKEMVLPQAQADVIRGLANNGGGGSTGGAVTVIQNFTVGDVASVSMVRQAVAGSESRIATAMGRSQRYGGQLA